MLQPIVVFGSINLDLVARSPRLPVPGETLLGHDLARVPGGKGANQAVAAARLGVPTMMVGRVGSDGFGQELLASLQRSQVQCEGVQVDTSTHSGVAIIAVADDGENHIIVIPGANGQVNLTDVERLQPLLEGASSLLLQFEIPLPAVQMAAAAARAAGVRVILDPAPAIATVPSELYTLVDILTPNAVEAAQLVGFAVDTPAEIERAAKALLQRGVKQVVIKLGETGAFCATASEAFWVPAFSVQAIDTVAAGDAFNAGMAVALAEGRSLRESLTWGSAAGALTVTKTGAQSSLPDRAALEACLV
ncbi:MAG: ribokinase [Scytolyngbya sp. HA4215-MV1]|jgi:ribokinase|nr:ribokinase [Scytolyngbya sp. HA4215-MV1]